MVLPWLGALAALLLLLVASLAVIEPPEANLWKLSIAVGEGGHFLVPPCLVLSLWSLFRPGGVGKATGAMLLLSALLFASPLVRGHIVAKRLRTEFALVFPEGAHRTSAREAPLVVRDLLFGIPLERKTPRVIAYVRRDGADLRLDFLPGTGGTRPAPCILVIHGGGWDSGHRGQLADLNHYLSARGFAVASLDYRHAPRYRYPAPVEDVKEAMAYLRAHARELDIDPERMVMLGRSAGGQIALQAAYLLGDPGIRGVVAFYAPADMVFGYSLPVNPLILDSRLLMENYLGGPYDAVPEAYRASSPVESAGPGAPPTLLLHGRPDVLVAYEHSRRLGARLTSLGVPNFTVDLPWAAHGYDYFFSGPGSQISLYFLERFLAEVTGRP